MAAREPEESRPSALRLHHVALEVADPDACERFYCDKLGMRVIWRPDRDNVYLTNGTDKLALHRASEGRRAAAGRLDHIGFALAQAEDVDAWHDFLVARGVPIVAAPRTHRDASRSLYCEDPDGTVVQLLYEPGALARAARFSRGGRPGAPRPAAVRGGRGWPG